MAKIDVAPDSVTISGVTYTRDDLIPSANTDSPIKIVILQRGWVMVGRWSRDGDDCALDDAHVIERWGTTQGIGQLVAGPTQETQLRKCGHVEFHILGVIASISCLESAWSL